MLLDQLSQKRFGSRIFESFETAPSGDVEKISDLRRQLDRAGYDEVHTCALLKLPSLLALQPEHFDYYDRWILPETPLANLVRLFLLDLPLPRQALEAALSPSAVEFLAKLGVIVPVGERWHSQVHLFCLEDLLVATDTGRYSPLWPEEEDMPDRVMYLGYDSIGLSCTAPRSRTRRTLDLCCGSGIQALVAARYSEEVIGVDLNPRAVRFSRFNAALNGLRNARFIEGDLFDPVRGATFSRILANPPFVPQPDSLPRLLYRDGGPTGEHILRRIIQEGPQLLDEHGLLAITTDLVNLEGLEERIHEWGEGVGPPLDVLVLVERELPISRYVQGHSAYLQTWRARRDQSRLLLDHLRSAGVSTIHGGYILLRRLPDNLEGSFQVLDTARELTRPASSHVEEYFRCRAAIRSGVPGRSRIGLAEGLHFRMNVASTSDEEHHSIELHSPEDAFFPQLEIIEGVHQLLRYIQVNRPLWSEVATANTQPLLEDLLLRGVLRLMVDG
jgi:carbamoyltransferase